MNYASIEEAYGGDLQGKIKKKKNKTQDPICELYEQKMSTSPYSQLDLVNGANAEYEKVRYQRNSRPLPNSDEVERENPIKNVNINRNDKYYDVSEQEAPIPQQPLSLFEKQFEIKNPNLFDDSCKTEDESNESDLEAYVYKRQPIRNNVVPKAAPQKHKGNQYYEEYFEDIANKKQSKMVYLDILLYIISGIILIFVMENILNIGINMQRF